MLSKGRKVEKKKGRERGRKKREKQQMFFQRIILTLTNQKIK
jgi:hypothetical protein